MSKSCKFYLREKFDVWYASEVEKQVAMGVSPCNVRVDTKMKVMKEFSAQWLFGFSDYLASKPDIIRNGFKAAGIIHTLDG